MRFFLLSNWQQLSIDKGNGLATNTEKAHYLNQWWSSSLMWYGIIRTQRVKEDTIRKMRSVITVYHVRNQKYIWLPTSEFKQNSEQSLSTDHYIKRPVHIGGPESMSSCPEHWGQQSCQLLNEVDLTYNVMARQQFYDLRIPITKHTWEKRFKSNYSIFHDLKNVPGAGTKGRDK